jgi:hypothetical protein
MGFHLQSSSLTFGDLELSIPRSCIPNGQYIKIDPDRLVFTIGRGWEIICVVLFEAITFDLGYLEKVKGKGHIQGPSFKMLEKTYFESDKDMLSLQSSDRKNFNCRLL